MLTGSQSILRVTTDTHVWFFSLISYWWITVLYKIRPRVWFRERNREKLKCHVIILVIITVLYSIPSRFCGISDYSFYLFHCTSNSQQDICESNRYLHYSCPQFSSAIKSTIEFTRCLLGKSNIEPWEDSPHLSCLSPGRRWGNPWPRLRSRPATESRKARTTCRETDSHC